jgi:hypothetical protein
MTHEIGACVVFVKYIIPITLAISDVTYSRYGCCVLYVEVQSQPKWEHELEKLILTMLKSINVMDEVYGMIFSNTNIVMVRLYVVKSKIKLQFFICLAIVIKLQHFI